MKHPQMMDARARRGLAWSLASALALASLCAMDAPAQAPEAPASEGPGFWAPRRRPERPDTSRVSLIRFMTEGDYPPFNFAGPDGNPVGFNIDLARMICDELKVPCTMQMRRFDTLIDALNENRGDAAIASMAVTAETRERVDFSDPYYRPVGPFVARRRGGAGIAVKRGNDILRQAFNWALFRLWEKGKFSELWLRYFPVNPYW